MIEERRSVQLPADLCLAAEEKFGPRHGTLEQFLTFVLRELIRDDTAMNRAEQSLIEKRLKDLGYL